MIAPTEFTLLDNESDTKMHSFDKLLACFDKNWPLDASCNVARQEAVSIHQEGEEEP
jgi:hypothetical protein